MDYYIDIELKPDAEMRENVLLNMTYTKLHKHLNDLKQTAIGVSFPHYTFRLGNLIRIHGTRNNLEALQQSHWLGGLIGYCSVSDILPVPDKVEGYRTVSRVRQNMTHAKLQRLIKRGSISGKAINSYKAKMYSSSLDQPYLELDSRSNGNKYRRYIKFGALSDKAVVGIFDQFGLSKTATVPWF